MLEILPYHQNSSKQSFKKISFEKLFWHVSKFLSWNSTFIRIVPKYAFLNIHRFSQNSDFLIFFRLQFFYNTLHTMEFVKKICVKNIEFKQIVYNQKETI